ncbi:MAG: hypothetical protein DRJ10_19355 [Bacteroidetes bacterium]|nr:MAG: hypothetical protein DRJ10_19355 [Bacteroidota bacterium]
MLVKLPKYDFSDVKIDFIRSQKDNSVYENDSTIVFIYGYPYSTTSDKWINANDIYNYYVVESLDFINTIDGFYSIMIIDKIKNISYFIVDRYGIYTLFYNKCKRYILVSDNIKQIIDNMGTVELNQQSIIEYLNFGYKIGNKTHIKGIFELEAAKKYEVDIDLIVKRRTYWNLLDLTESSKMSDKEFCTTFNEHHKKILKISNNLCVPFTGGRDTRTILSCYMENLEKINTYTHGPNYHTDVKLAQKVCSSLNIKHTYYKLNGDWFKGLTSKTFLLSDNKTFNGLNPFFDYTHVVDSLQKEQSKSDVFLSGILGNQLYRNHPFGNKIPESVQLKSVAAFIIKNLPSVFNFKTDLGAYYENVFTQSNINQINEQILKAVEKELSNSIGAVSPLDYIQYFLYSTYSSNFASSILQLTGKYFKVIGSFFHKDLLQQVRLMSLRDRTKASIQNYIIKNNSIYLSKLPYYNSKRITKYTKLILNKLWNHTFNRNLFHNPNVVNYPYWLRKYHKEFLLKTLDYDHMKLKSLFNKKEINHLISLFIENKSSFRSKKALLFNFSLDKFIINLISLELWLKDIEQLK